MDEFGFGSFNTNVGQDYPVPRNPVDKERVVGGSSGGSAGITKKADFPHVSIAESTGGSIEAPAAYCGVIGFCPTYGLLSRNGLISYANSLDKIGIMSKESEHIRPVLEVMAGFDSKDSTSLKRTLDLDFDGDLKVAVIEEGLDVDEGVKENFLSVIENLDFDASMVSMPFTFKYGISAYYVLAASEASTNLAKYSGLRYGQETKVEDKSFNQYFKEVRGEHFNEESKRRIILGTFARMAGYREQYYMKATKVRTKIIEEYKKLFEEFDVLLTPTMPNVAPKISEVDSMSPVEVYKMDSLTVGPNLAGVPHVTIPSGEYRGLPTGLMAIADHVEEEKLLKFLEEVERCQR